MGFGCCMEAQGRISPWLQAEEEIRDENKK
jgi:hypothetical protein